MLLPVLLLLAATPNPQSWKFDTDGTPHVEVSNINGSIKVEAAAGNRVDIQASPRGDADKLSRVQLVVEQQGDRVVAKVKCEGGFFNKNDCPSGVTVDWAVRLPAGAAVEVSGVNSEINVTGVKGEHEVSTVNGNVKIAAAGAPRMEVSTVNGEVDVGGSAGPVEVSSVSGNVQVAPRAVGKTSVSTVSGDVRLQLPGKGDATVDFSSVSGDFNGQSTRMGGTSRTFGTGEQRVSVSTVSGELEVKTQG